MKNPRTLGVLIGAAVLVAGCATDDPQRDALPARPATPTGAVVLTIDGPAGEVDWDLAALEALPQVEAEIRDPFLDTDRVFRGPAFHDVLVVSGVDAAATGAVELIALDDYRFTLPTDADQLDGTILALSDGGSAIDVADGGPIRLVFADGSPFQDDVDAWIWSVRTGVVR